MLHGYAWNVRYVGRPDQSYVSVDTAYVGNDILSTARNLGWRIEVSLIAFRGEGALAITSHVSDIFETVDVSAEQWFVVDKGRLVSRKR